MPPQLIALLIRHAHSSSNGTCLTGRLPGVHVSDRGQRELARLQRQLAAVTIDAIYSSPLERALQTAAALRAGRAIGVNVVEDLNEMDFGDWTGRTFDQLDADPRWREFNAQRRTARVPNGECATDVQRRVVDSLRALSARHAGGGVIAIVSHAEVIRSAVLWYLKRSLDEFHRLAIDTASVSAVRLSSAPRVLFTNATGSYHLSSVVSGGPNSCAVSVSGWPGTEHRSAND